MAAFVFVFAALCLAVSAAPPAPPRLYPHQAPAQLQQINPLDYYLDHPELHSYYNQQQQQQKQDNAAVSQNQPSRLETLEPDSEVELIPGAQTPQQPPQQPPVHPNLPGLVPGQRVFIVHMPVPGYRPGTISGYQPVYIVAAAPQANPGFPGNGYHNAVLLDPSNQVVAPLGYPRGVIQGGNPGLVQGGNPGLVQGGNPALVQGGNPLILGAPQLLNRPYDLVYQDPGVAYQQAGPAGLQAGPNSNQGSVRLAQLVNLQSQPAHSGRPQATEVSSAEPKQLSQPIIESKEGSEEPRRNVRPTSAHAKARTKA